MEFTINTTLLQSMLARALKGVGNNKLIPLTSMIAIEIKNNELRLTTTDGTNYLYITHEYIYDGKFNVVVDAEFLGRLIARTTSETITFKLADTLEIIGNGTYNIELMLDENGEPVKFPDPAAELNDLKDGGAINKALISAILLSLKPALAVTLEQPELTGYYSADKIVASDGFKIAYMKADMLKEPRLISAETMNLLEVMPEDKISIGLVDDVMLFTSKDCALYSKAMQYIDDYSIDAMTSYVEREFDARCRISRDSLLSLLERLSLFVTAYDDNAISLVFTDKGLQVSSKSANAVELIPYKESEKHIDYSCEADVKMFMEQIKACASDVVDIEYGDESALKFVDGNTIQICALYSDED